MSAVHICTIYISDVRGNNRNIKIDLEYFQMCLPILERPPHTTAVRAQFPEIIRIQGEAVQAARHHIIPYNVLESFFNVVSREVAFQHELGRYLAGRVRDILEQFKAHQTAGHVPERLASRFAGRSVSFEVDNRMIAAFAWMPGNLFYGPEPQRRSDDPRFLFQEHAEIIVGRANFATLSRLYQRMIDFVNIRNEQTVENFERIMNDLDEVNRIRVPYAFNERQWIIEKISGKTMFKIPGIMDYEGEITTTTHRTGLKRRSLETSMDVGYFLATNSDGNAAYTYNPYDNALALCDSLKVKLLPK